MERPRLKAHYAVEVVGGTQVYLLSEDRHFLLSGRAAVALLPHLDGRNTVGDIALALSDSFTLAHVVMALRKYDSGGHLAEGRPDLPDAELAYWDALDVDPALVSAARGARRVAVLATGGADADPFAAALDAAGLSVQRDTADGADLAVVVVSDHLDPELHGLNERFLAAGLPWLPVKPGGAVAWLGPLLRPGSTGCWECMRQRLTGNRQVERFVQQQRGNEKDPFATSRGAAPGSADAVARTVAVDVLEILATGNSPTLDGTLVTLDRRTLETTPHVLVRQPHCPACGDPALVTARDPRIVLRPQPVAFSNDNGLRTVSSFETRTRLERHISPLLGAISGLASLNSGDNEITYSYGAGHDFPMGSAHVELLRKNVRGQSGGKGRTDTQARVSAMAEAIERYSGIWRTELPVRRATFAELGPDDAVHPHELLLFSPAQYATRETWNHTADMLQTVPEAFRDDHPCDWTTAWSLTHDRPRLVPAAHVWFGHPDLQEHFFTICDANGNAAGNVLEEAILQGFCELIERDCVATWWYNRIPRPGVDLDSLDDPYIETVRRYYRAQQRELWMLDISSDLEVPAFAAVSRRVGHPVDDVVVGFGAHPSAQIAMMRALTEMNQFLPFISERDDDGNTVYPGDGEAAIIDWLRTTRIDDAPWLRPAPGAPLRRVEDHPSPDGQRLDETLQAMLTRAAAAGLEVLVVDQSRPEIELNVAKVMVPGLRHFWRRLGRGRLYDVPVRLGWIDRPVPEAELNPKSVFF